MSVFEIYLNLLSLKMNSSIFLSSQIYAHSCFIAIFEIMKTVIFFFASLIFVNLLSAQFTADFSKSGLKGWQGDTARFTVANGQLQLADAAPASANTSSIAVAAPTSFDSATVWECLVRLDFSPSNTNFARVYLTAAAQNLNASVNGYFVQVGGLAGNDDALQLYRQDGSSTQLLINGKAGAIGTATVNVRIRVERDTAGKWTLLADYIGGKNFQPEGNAIDKTYRVGAFFGLWCRYSATRNRSFFFDDVLVKPLFKDKQAPRFLSVKANKNQQLFLQFDEPLDKTGVGNLAAYQVNPGVPIAQAVLDNGDPTLLILSLQNALTNLTEYTVTVAGLRDLAGNAMTAQSQKFSYLDLQPAQPGDLFITEIMADPLPAIGSIPPVEYIEIWNRSNKAISTDNLRFSKGSTPIVFPVTFLLPNAYYILTATENVEAFRRFGNVIGITGFPALTNSGDLLQILNTTGVTLAKVNYSIDWYAGSPKADGGWSLELISADIAADCAGNWQPSNDPNGGTPGKANSVQGQISDRTPPQLRSAVPLSATEIRLFFDKPLDPSTAEDSRLYQLDNGIIIRGAILQSNNREVSLPINGLIPGQIANLTILPGLKDCLGNTATRLIKIQVGLPQIPATGDLVINEVLFNPASGGSDFVELYNRSNKLISLQGMTLTNRQKTSGTIQTSINSPYLLLPGKWVAISANIRDVQNRYPIRDSSAFLSNDLPSLDDNFGNITLQNNKITLDSFDYSNKLHNPLLDSEDGVSLERLSVELPTNSSGNWHSAASTVKGATPGYQNSQAFALELPTGPEVFKLENATFSPDDDGYQDVLSMPYRSNGPEYLANIRIFDALGRPTRILAQNLSIGNEGVLKWDGATDDNLKARIGIYIVWIELFEPGGKKTVQKLTCVLAGRL